MNKRKVWVSILGILFAASFEMASHADDMINSNFEVSFGATISYQESGKPDGPAVILIHGFPVNYQMWGNQVEALKEKFRVITFDLRGLGQSKIQDGQYTLEIMVDDLFALLDHLKIKKTHLVGFSMGGYIALRAVERDDDRFQSLTLVDTQSLADSDEGKLKRTGALKAIKADGLKAFGQSFSKASLSKKTLHENPRVAEQLMQMIESNSVLGVSGGLLAMVSRTDTTGSLPQIKVPTLILVGEEDSITPPKIAQMMRDQIPQAKLEVIPGSGHFTPLENPKAFNSSLVSFLSGNL